MLPALLGLPTRALSPPIHPPHRCQHSFPNKSDATSSFTEAPKLFLMKLCAIDGVKSVFPGPPRQQLGPTPQLSLFHSCHKGKGADFGGEGYTGELFKNTQSVRLIPSLFSHQWESHDSQYQNWQNTGCQPKSKELHGQRIYRQKECQALMPEYNRHMEHSASWAPKIWFMSHDFTF